MNEIEKYNCFSFDSNTDYSSKPLTNLIFKDIDFKSLNSSVSFYRCDFRGSSFSNVIFYKNNFDRADFISCTFVNCDFQSVNFGRSQIKNCYFKNCKFTNNTYNTNTIQDSIFEMCTLDSEKIISNISYCSYLKSTIINCDCNRSSMDRITIQECIINDTNIATLHADKFRFISCKINQVKMGLPYLFGYLFYNTSLTGVDCLYRGTKVSSNYFLEYANKLLTEKRYSEYVNSIIIRQKTKNIDSIISDALHEIMSNDNNIYIRDELTFLFETIEFYTEHEILNYSEILNITRSISNFNVSKYSKDIQLLFLSHTGKIEYILKTNDFSPAFYNNTNYFNSVITFYCNTDDFDAAINATELIMNDICREFDISKDDGYTLFNSERGSWVLTYIVVSTIALILPRVLKSYSDIIIEFKLKKALSKKLLKLINESNNINKITKIAKVASKTTIIKNNKENPDKVMENSIKLLEALDIKL